jgi:two-component system, chemotaxis family, CheB/CheR fusion protein
MRMAKSRRPKKPSRSTRQRSSPAPSPGLPLETGDAAMVMPESQMVVVGIGASAGGLDAFTQLLHALPAKPGFAIVLVQHMAPQHESALADLLSMQTSLPVVQAADGMRVVPNHVYVIPPNVQALMRDDGSISLLPRPKDRTQYTPVDAFLRSLAEVAGDRAIGVILSGTASDGTQGVQDVNAMGGFTFAQTPETARYDGMPRAAIATGLIDMVGSPSEIADELVRLTGVPFAPTDPDKAALPRHSRTRETQFDTVLGLLRAATGVDFTRYKPTTIQRRLQRRMVLHKLDGLGDYVKYLEANPTELQALYQDILIHVTRFFREPSSFEALKSSVLPVAMNNRGDGQPLRMWVCGCSTGEEAYSLAMTVFEFLEDAGQNTPIQLFATDVSESAIEHARDGSYPESIAADVSPERLRRFFSKLDSGYRIVKRVRDVCVFARQDVTRDPPFSRLDLILCRNVLIYMGAHLQKRVMTVFHYALKPTGFLMLGHSETVGSYADLFAVTDKKHRVFQKKPNAVPTLALSGDYPARMPLSRKLLVPVRDDGRAIQQEAERLVQERYAPPGVVIDADLQIVQFRGQTGRFLEPASGDPSLNVLKMAREGMLYGLRSVLNKVRKGNAAVRKDGIRVRSNGGWLDIAVEAIPLASPQRRHYLILFHESKNEARQKPKQPVERPGKRLPRRESLAQLERELQSSRDYLQSIIQELEAANEELQSANEEVLSANEELQSTNEELDTAKEELQSTNEELNTVNEELQGRNEELSRVNSDLLNLLASVQIAIVIVSSDLRIRRFTPMAERVLNLIPSDVGRPIGHIKPNIDCPDLEQLTLDVIESVVAQEREVRDRQGHWLSLQIRPYKNLENRIDGAVLALFDVDTVRRHAVEVRELCGGIVESVHEPLAILDLGLRVSMVNRPFEREFGVSRKDIQGRFLDDYAAGRWGATSLRKLLEEELPKTGYVENFRLERGVSTSGGDHLLVSARRVMADGTRAAFIVLAMRPSDGKAIGP